MFIKNKFEITLKISECLLAFNGRQFDMDDTSSSSSRSSGSPQECAGFIPIEDRSSELEATPSVSMGSYSKAKGLPTSPDRVAKARKRLWEVDTTEVDSSLENELKRIAEEENKISSSKWNFDFKRDVPMSGGVYAWEPVDNPPTFYMTKEVTSKKRKVRSEDEAHSSKSHSEEPELSEMRPSSSKKPHLVSTSHLDLVTAPTTSDVVTGSSVQEPVSTSSDLLVQINEESLTPLKEDINSPPNKKLCVSRKEVDSSTSTCQRTSSVSIDSRLKCLSPSSDCETGKVNKKLITPTSDVSSGSAVRDVSGVTLSIPSSTFYSQRPTTEKVKQQKCASSTPSTSEDKDSQSSSCTGSSSSSITKPLSEISGDISATPVGTQKPHSTKESSPTSTQRPSSSELLSPKYFR